MNLFIYLFGLFFSLSLQAQLIVLKTDQKSYPIENKWINESSGLACSNRNKKILWTHNDSGHMPIIYALSHKGKDRGTFYLDDVVANDWEDMDAFDYQGEHYLLIADTGDNYRLRWDYQVFIIKEPIVNKKKKTQSALSPAWSFVFKYADNKSYDVESVAVDPLREKIVLLSKRTTHSWLFELPLKPADNGAIPVALKIAELKEISKPSALDISADGKLMSINTYARIHRYRREGADDSWHYDSSLKYKKLFQPEGMCLGKDENLYFVSSERKSRLLNVNIPDKQ